MRRTSKEKRVLLVTALAGFAAACVVAIKTNSEHQRTKAYSAVGSLTVALVESGMADEMMANASSEKRLLDPGVSRKLIRILATDYHTDTSRKEPWLDPWSTAYFVEYWMEDQRLRFRVVSAGPDRRQGTKDDIVGP